MRAYERLELTKILVNPSESPESKPKSSRIQAESQPKARKLRKQASQPKAEASRQPMLGERCVGDAGEATCSAEKQGGAL